MSTKKLLYTLAALLVLAGVADRARQPQAQRAVRANPDPGCSATPEQIEANTQLVMNPVGNPNDRIDPSYKQHNPAFIKGAREAGVTDYAYFMQRFGGPGRAGGGPGGGGRGPGGGQAGAPQPPPGNGNEVVVAQCDIVIQLHMNNRQDPTAAPGTWYQAFTFDAWRVRGGKIVEHWDSAVINPPPAPAPPAAQ